MTSRPGSSRPSYFGMSKMHGFLCFVPLSLRGGPSTALRAERNKFISRLTVRINPCPDTSTPSRKNRACWGLRTLVSPVGRLIHDEELSPGRGRRAVRGTAVANVVALARLQDELSAIAKRDIQHARQTQDHVTLGAPVIGGITGRVLDHTNTNVAKGLGLPKGKASLSGML